MGDPINSTTDRRTSLKLILWTALLVGTLDICAAFLNSYLSSGVSPAGVLKFIASGAFGRQAFEGGILIASLGLLFHFVFAFSWTLIFFIVFPKIKFHHKYKIPVGIGYGILIWLIMNLIILPLSNTPKLSPQFPQILLSISFIMFLVGLPISLIFYKFDKRQVDKN